jgi:hypothetical protein
MPLLYWADLFGGKIDMILNWYNRSDVGCYFYLNYKLMKRNSSLMSNTLQIIVYPRKCFESNFMLKNIKAPLKRAQWKIQT